MIVSWFVGRGMRDDGGLFCTNCNHAFSADYCYFFINMSNFIHGKKADKFVFCPYCGDSSIYPNASVESAYENYCKYKNILRVNNGF